MEKLQLTAQDYVLALFVLCADITCWEVQKENRTYYYFNPKSQNDLNVVRYILKKNNVRATKHASRQYGGAEYYKNTRKVLRVPVGKFAFYADEEFFRFFKEMRASDDKPVPDSAGAHRMFALWSDNKKAKFINDILINKTR